MKLLVRLPNWLGDVVMSTAFIDALRLTYFDAEIDIIIKKELSSIAPLIPGINKIHTFSKNDYPGLKGVYAFGKSLRDEQYDIYFNLPSSISSAAMAWATRAKKRVGFSKEGGFLLLTKVCKRPQNVHRVEEYLSILEQFTGKTPKGKVGLTIANEPNSLVLVNFNSEAVSRRMPIGKSINLINQLTNTFQNVHFALVGSPKDSDHIDQIYVNAENKERIKNLTGKTNLVELAKLMAGAKAVLTTDSGPAHLANSVGAPVIALFGAGNEHNTAPYNKENLTVIRAGKLDCEPCVRNTCELYGAPKCMKLIDAMQIINALSVYLNHHA